MKNPMENYPEGLFTIEEETQSNRSSMHYDRKNSNAFQERPSLSKKHNP